MRIFGPWGHKRPDPKLAGLSSSLNAAETRYLEALRREIANLIVAQDPATMVKCYERAWRWERETAQDPDRLRADELSLVAKFKSFQDFDIIGTRHFITYANVSQILSEDDIIERYIDISRMMVILKNRSELEWDRRRPVHDEREHKILLENMQKENNRRLRIRIEDALKRYYAYRNGCDVGVGSDYTKSEQAFSDAEVDVFRFPYGTSPEIETGVVFKKTEEFGVFSFFVHDDGHTTDSYYRSDWQFKKREPLSL